MIRPVPHTAAAAASDDTGCYTGSDTGSDTGSHPRLGGFPAAAAPVTALARAVVVDCDGCSARPAACGDCVVTFLLGGPPEQVELDDQEQQALAVLADSGLVPELRYEPDPGPRMGRRTGGRRAEGRVEGHGAGLLG